MEINLLKAAEYLMMFSVLFFTVTMLLLYLSNRRIFHGGRRTRIRYEPTVSVVLPAFNEQGTIAKTVRSVLDADYPKEKLQVVVVNDGSTDKTAEAVASIKDKRILLINKANSGKADSLNRGIAAAKGEIVVTLDADCYITRGSLKTLMGYFDEDVAAVTSAVKVKPKSKMGLLERLQRLEYLFTIFNRRVFSMINSVYVTPGPMSAFRKKVFDEVGGFDPKNIMEDQEIALRIQSANYRIESCLDAVVYTDVPKDFKTLMRQRIRWNRGGFRNTMKYSYMAHPRYGDFGAFVMPYSIASVFLFFLVLGLVGTAMATGVSQAIAGRIYEPRLLIEPIHVISLIVLVLTIIWTYMALSKTTRKIDKSGMVLYTFLYGYLVTLFMVTAVYKELRGEEAAW